MPNESPGVGSVEATSAMRGRYRRKLIHLLAGQVAREQASAGIYRRGARSAPGPDEERLAAGLAEAQSGQRARFVELLVEQGLEPDDVAQFHRDQRVFRTAGRVLTPRLSWLDLVLFRVVVAGYGTLLLEDFASSSYAPLVRASRAMRAGPPRQLPSAASLLQAEVKRSGAARVQRAAGKWWRIGLNFFAVGTRNDAYRTLGLLPRSAEERLAAFRADLAPTLGDAGLALPRLLRQRFPYL